MLHWRLHSGRNHCFKVSHLRYAVHPYTQYQITVKLLGSFRLAAGRRHLHRPCIFTEQVPETVPNSLYHSCASELTRQGISLIVKSHFRTSLQRTISSPYFVGAQRVVSEDSKNCDRVLRFIRSIFRAIERIPAVERCLLRNIDSTISANNSKSFCFAVRNECFLKNGMIVSRKSLSDLTQYRYRCS